jgi:hypothetical protein
MTGPPENRPLDRDASSTGAGDRAAEPARRRRRVRSDGSGQTPVPSPAALAAMTSPIHDEDTSGADTRADTGNADTPSADIPNGEAPAGEDREVERGLRGLVGGGSSQVSVTAAMRARDATRPTPDDLASAETNLMIIRRGWTPPDAKR